MVLHTAKKKECNANPRNVLRWPREGIVYLRIRGVHSHRFRNCSYQNALRARTEREINDLMQRNYFVFANFNFSQLFFLLNPTQIIYIISESNLFLAYNYPNLHSFIYYKNITEAILFSQYVIVL